MDDEYRERIRAKVDSGRRLSLYESELVVAENRALHNEVSRLTAEAMRLERWRDRAIRVTTALEADHINAACGTARRAAP